MSQPVRIQLSRKKGFSLQAASWAANGLSAIKVDRTSPFGNPFSVSKDPFEKPAVWDVFDRRTLRGSFPSKEKATAFAIECFKAEFTQTGTHNSRLIDPVPTPVDIAKALRGFNLACWCKPGEACHADILLEIANSPLQEIVDQ